VSAGDAVRMRSRRLLAASEALRRLSPQAVLDRGYAIVTDEQGTVLRAPDALAEGQRLRVRLAEGAVQVNVLGPSLG
jgi:exodeoxyribonuclease VII large subunit